MNGGNGSENGTISLSAWPVEGDQITARLLIGDSEFIQPPGDDSRDLLVVLLQHHDVAVAMDADVGELDVARLHPGLLQIPDGAMVVGGVV
jgi:hypothetical protein